MGRIMKGALMALLAGLAPAAALAQPAATDLDRGVALRLAGRSAEAAATLERAAHDHPEDADVWLNLGLAYSALGRFDAAETALHHALTLAPDYTDATIALARLSYFRGDLDEAQRRLLPALRQRPDNPEARDLAAQIATARASDLPWRLDAFTSQGFLSRSLPQANDTVLTVSRRIDGRNVVGVSVERAQQFGQTDTFAEAQFGTRIGSIAVGGAPNSHFRPRWSVRGELISPKGWLNGAWSLQPVLDLSWSRYLPGDVRTFAPGFELTHGDTWSLGARWINVVDETNSDRGGYSVRSRWRPTVPVELSAGWSDAVEFDEFRTLRVKTASLGAGVDISTRTTLSLSVDHEMHSLYDRDNLNLGLKQRF
jgi:YaiO family outer membrane protein